VTNNHRYHISTINLLPDFEEKKLNRFATCNLELLKIGGLMVQKKFVLLRLMIRIRIPKSIIQNIKARYVSMALPSIKIKSHGTFF